MHTQKLGIIVPIVVVIVVIVVITFMFMNRSKHSLKESFVTLNAIDEDTMFDGNPLSLSGLPNPYIDINQKGQQDPIIYQSNGIPLSHEDHPTTPSSDPSMFYFKNYSCRPECCQYSAFSCTNGCVCWEAQPQGHYDQNNQLTPRS
jgi:hypothetical protein